MGSLCNALFVGLIFCETTLFGNSTIYEKSYKKIFPNVLNRTSKLVN